MDHCGQEESLSPLVWTLRSTLRAEPVVVAMDLLSAVGGASVRDVHTPMTPGRA